MSDPPALDLVVENARLMDGSTTDLGIRGGRFSVIGDCAGLTTATRLDAGGRLVTPAFVDGHLHLDKVYTLPMLDDVGIAAYTSGSMGEAMTSIELASTVKRQYDRTWIVPNVRRALEQAVRYGVLTIQAFVDVDTTAGLEGMHAVLAVREEFADVLDVRVVAFPQDGLLRDPGAADLCAEALEMGADVVGGIPWIENDDADALRHIRWACEQARAQNRRVAMLVDEAGDPALRTIGMLAEQLIEHDLVGRGVACHARAAGSYRGRLLPVGPPQHAGGGVPERTPPRFRSTLQQRLLVELVTSRAAAAVGLADYGIVTGGLADFCVHQHERVVDLLREHGAPSLVYRRGRLLAETTPFSTHIHHAGPTGAD